MIYVRQEKSFLGLGDLLNMFSYENRTLNNVKITYNFDEHRTILSKFLLENVIKDKYSIERFFGNFVENEIKFNPKYKLINHEYWPSKIKKISTKRFSICLSLYHYKEIKKPNLDILKKYDNSNNISRKEFLEYKENCTFYKIYNKAFTTNEYNFYLNMLRNFQVFEMDHRFYLTSLSNNIKSISKSNLFVGSDGGMAHIARILKIPSIIYFRDDSMEFNYINNVKNYVDSNLQKLCTDKNTFFNEVFQSLEDRGKLEL